MNLISCDKYFKQKLIYFLILGLKMNCKNMIMLVACAMVLLPNSALSFADEDDYTYSSDEMALGVITIILKLMKIFS